MYASGLEGQEMSRQAGQLARQASLVFGPHSVRIARATQTLRYCLQHLRQEQLNLLGQVEVDECSLIDGLGIHVIEQERDRLRRAARRRSFRVALKALA